MLYDNEIYGKFYASNQYSVIFVMIYKLDIDDLSFRKCKI